MRAKALLLLVLLAVVTTTACAGRPQTTTATTTTETRECAEPGPYDEPGEERCSEVTREVTVVTETEPGCHGAVSCGGSLVGRILSLPFRIVGEVLATVF